MSGASDGLGREAREQLRTVANGLVEIETDPDPETVDAVFRAAHSLKGNCATAELEGASRLAHAIEDALAAIRSGDLDPGPELIDDALAAVDRIEAALDASAAGEPAPDPDPVASRLRRTVAEEREDAAAGSGGPHGDAAPDLPDPPTPDPAVAEDLSPEEALDRASAFEDLDALAADLDDDAVDDLGQWGTFEDGPASTPGDEVDQGPDDPAPRTTEGPATDADEPADDPDEASVAPGAALFEEVRSEVDVEPLEGDLAGLEADIEAEDFGEFDEQDDLSIRDLIEAEPADQVSSETEDAGAGEVAAAGEADASFQAVAEEVETETDLERLQADVEDEEFGEFDDEDVFTIPELVAAEPDDLDEEVALDTGNEATATDEEAAVADEEAAVADEEAASSVAADASSPPAEDAEAPSSPAGDGPDAPPTPTADDPGDHAEGAADADAEPTVDDDDAGDPFLTPDPVEGATADPVDGDDAGEESAASTDDGRSPTADAEALLDDVDLEAGPVGSEPDRPLETDETTADVDGPTESAPSVGDESGTDASFVRDADIEAFEERFGELFEEESAERLASGAARTLEESTLDVDARDADLESDVGEGAGTGSVTVDASVADALLRSVEELSMNHLRLERALRTDDGPTPEEVLGELRSVTAGLRDAVMDVRLTPLSAATDDLPRVVRAAARETDTEVSLEIEGADVRLDRGIVDRLGDPLAHLIRNAVAHGIESPSVRDAAGKPLEGTVEVRARRRRDRVVIEVRDDGQGLDPARIRRTAVDRGLVSEAEADDLSMNELYELLFHPGFTTAEEVSELSGRGVGLDVVDRAVAELNGTVEIDSEPGEGTTVRLSIPMSVAVAEVLFLESGDRRYAIRLSAIERVGRAAAVDRVDGREMVTLDTAVASDDPVALTADGSGSEERSPADDGDDADPAEADEHSDEDPDRYPLVRLAEAFDTDGSRGEDGVIVQVREDLRDLAIHCDDYGETREVVVDPYTGVLSDVPGIGGTTTLGDGELVNVIDVHTL